MRRIGIETGIGTRTLGTHNSITQELEEGLYSVRYELAGYLPVEFDITVVQDVPATYHETLTAISSAMSIEYYGSALLETHEVPKGGVVKAMFYVRNNGNTAAGAWSKIYVEGTQVGSQHTTPNINPGDTWLDEFTLNTSTVGTFSVSVEVGPQGEAASDTAADSYTVTLGTAAITFDTKPKGASVYLNGTLIGTT